MEKEKTSIWILKPTMVSNSYPEDNVLDYIKLDQKWDVEFEFKYLHDNQDDHVLIAFLPKFFTITIHKGYPFFSFNYVDGKIDFRQLLAPKPEYGESNSVRVVNTPNKGVSVFMNNVKVLFEPFENVPKGLFECSEIVLGSNTFLDSYEDTKDSKLIPVELKVSVGDELKCYHTFNNLIFDKSYDETGNLNYLVVK